MRLNPDCVRAILLTVEERSDGISSKKYDVSPDFPLLKEYPFNVFLYHVRQCKENGYLMHCKQDVLGDIYIEDLTPAGHELLAHIRDDKNWKRILSKFASKAVGTLPALAEIAATVISTAHE